MYYEHCIVDEEKTTYHCWYMDDGELVETKKYRRRKKAHHVMRAIIGRSISNRFTNFKRRPVTYSST